MASNMIQLTFEFEGSSKQVYVPSNLNYSQLHSIGQDLFSLNEGAARFSYTDDEGDRILISSDLELTEALSGSANKKLTIRLEKANTEPEIAQHPAVCDNCDEHIIGVRFKCVNCPDYDLCEECEGKADIHNPEHLFLKIYRPLPFPAGLPFSYGRPLLPNFYQLRAAIPFGRFGLGRCCRPAGPCGSRPMHPACGPCGPKSEVKCGPCGGEEKAKCEIKCGPNKCEIKCGGGEEKSKCEVKCGPSGSEEEVKGKEPAAPQESPQPSASGAPNSFTAKLERLDEMGFHDRTRSIGALVRSGGDLVGAVRELLN